MKLRMTKADVLATLQSKIPLAEAHDRDALAEHRKNNKAVAHARRAYLRELIKFPDDKLAEYGAWETRHGLPGSTSCPRSMTTDLKRQIALVERDSRKTFQLNDHDGLYRWITWGDEVGSKAVC